LNLVILMLNFENTFTQNTNFSSWMRFVKRTPEFVSGVGAI